VAKKQPKTELNQRPVGFRRGFLLQVGSFQMMMMIALITSKISLEREPLLKGLFAQMKLEGDLWSKLDIFATFLKCTSVSLLQCKLASPKPFAPTKYHVKHISWSMTILMLLHVSSEICANKSADFRRFSANQNFYAGIKRTCKPRAPGDFIARIRLTTKLHA